MTSVEIPPVFDTAVLHHSMRQLPEDPMTPRVFDPRVGFFTVGFRILQTTPTTKLNQFATSPVGS